PLSTILAGLDMSAQCRCAAVLDRRHNLELAQAEMSRMDFPIVRPCSTEDIGDLHRGTHGSAVWRLAFHQSHQSIKRSRDRVNGSGGDLRIESRRLQLAMPEQNLDDADIGAILQKMGCKAVPQGVRTDALADAGDVRSFLNRAMQLPRRDRIGAAAPWKQP